ncbi:cold shock domain-containing protein E1-like [Babylonia areolata]|uniref:cold shock domain-containing protein E1-like n=1 Tax=Babylonia areolata TaxID=304850 RepID=UPI003FCF552D
MSVKKLNSPQWKKFQPPTVQDPAILSFHQSPTTTLHSPTSGVGPNAAPAIREKGVIDKRQHSYGFIQCLDREARLFFHYSEYNGNIDVMKVGDPVEFSTSTDRRTGKPIAVHVTSIDVSQSMPSMVSDEEFVGTVIQEPKPTKNKNGTLPTALDGLGRVSYEHCGECFFLPFSQDDVVDPNTKLKPGDQVIFHLESDPQTGGVLARSLHLVIPPSQRYQGVICSMKESFGFIERADLVREIFFHYSEFRGNIEELRLGDDVEFSIQMRNNKEVAVEIEKLPDGTVIFEDLTMEKVVGRVLKTLKTQNGRRSSDPLGGRIFYEKDKAVHEIQFGDKDQYGDCTLQQGDQVSFNIATDRRDGLQRACQIQLLEETFANGEQRESGVIATLKEGYGFIQCADREARMFFHFSEFMDPEYIPEEKAEVQFTVMPDPSSASRMVATRIKVLPKGSVSFMNTHPALYVGTIEKEPATHKNQNKNKEAESGSIKYDFNSKIQSIAYNLRDLKDSTEVPHYGDKVEFQIGEQRTNNKKVAVNIKVLFRSPTSRCQGFVATLKDNYGFIENDKHDQEVFFHFSAFDGNANNDLDLGDEVEYTLARKSSKMSAENIRKLPKGTVGPGEDIVYSKGTVQGKIVRPMRIVDPEQDEYCGLVQAGLEVEEGEPLVTYPYGITSLADKRDFLQKGDIVSFQVAKVKGTEVLRAVNLAAQRKFVRAKVDSVKGQFGFLNYEVAEEGKKLFFHMTEVHDSAQISPGDEVEFVVVQNQRNGKYSACSLRKITEKQRPERLISRLKSFTDDSSPRIVVDRQPRGPDGTRGFSTPRTPWKPPS